ncbi:MAG TPA: ABC transporter substrate-binding protein [Methylomirabilota bacterium]|jgi:phospholipid transport system substrate-binding protein|nr:ABC transporter substrate-binding protein [Methylomirabilota bacterium]
MIRGLLLLALALALPGQSVAGPPTDQLRQSVELVVKTLSDPELKKDTKSGERRAMIRRVANEIFDFSEISQRSLGRHWQARTPTEREEFVRLFADLLEQSYIAKIESYSDEKILYTGEVIDGEQAVVKTRIVTRQGAEIPVDYRTFLRGERWRAYDVNIEGVSLVANYRTQFNTIIQRNGYPDLVAKLKAKQDERPGPRETGRRRDEATGPSRPGTPTRQSP